MSRWRLPTLADPDSRERVAERAGVAVTMPAGGYGIEVAHRRCLGRVEIGHLGRQVGLVIVEWRYGPVCWVG